MLFDMLLNDDIVAVSTKADGICLLTFVVDEFSGIFLNPLVLTIMH